MKASNRRRIGHALVAGFAFLTITLGNFAAVRAQVVGNPIAIATFNSSATKDFVYTGGTTMSTLTTSPSELPGTVTWSPLFYLEADNLPAFITLSASSTTAAFQGSQTGFDGSFTISQAANVFSVAFTDADLNVTGASATLGGNATAIFANFGAPITSPESFLLSLSGVAPPVSVGPLGFTNFTGDAVLTVQSVPEPSTIAIAGIGALCMIGYGLRRRKAPGA